MKSFVKERKKLFLSIIFGGLLSVLAIVNLYVSNTGVVKILKGSKMETLKVGYPKSWGSLIPTQQNTVYADSILSNVYEPLVDMKTSGSIAPLAAESWRINEDFTRFEFFIDKNRRFSDGTFLKPIHFKNTWEQALREKDINSANNNLVDLLSRIKGYKSFSVNGGLNGVVATEISLTLHFSVPFRVALEHLTGARFAPYLAVEGKTIGTGAYTVVKNDGQEAVLEANPYSAKKTHFQNVIVSVVDNPEKAMAKDKIDVYAFYRKPVTECIQKYSDLNMSCYTGHEAYHSVVAINGVRDSIFVDPALRLAMQYLLNVEYFNSDSYNKLNNEEKYAIKIDSQSYLPMQQGRLEDSQSKKLVEEGFNYLKRLVDVSKSRPIRFYYNSDSALDKSIHDFLVRYGLIFSQDSGPLGFKERLSLLYKSYDLDMATIALSIFNSDPDGLYHSLGREGAILMPVQSRPYIQDLLEQGRNITDRNSIKNHYERVQEQLLKDVPYVHLGFIMKNTLYRIDKVEPDQEYMGSRIREYFHTYLPKD